MNAQTIVGLVQIHNGFQAYFPYSAGLLQAYTQSQSPQTYDFLPIIYRSLSIQEALQQLSEAQIVGFSTYIWNIKRSLAIARALKEQNPDVLIIFGGPQVPDKAEAFLRENPFIDICCHGEGERVFYQLLTTYPQKNWKDISGISYLDKATFMSSPKGPRINDLNKYPSPYLVGVFEPLINANPDEQWLMAMETNRGCPFSCTFCDWGSAINSKIYRFDLKRIFKELDWFAQYKIEGLNICDANFGILKRDVRIARYIALTFEQCGFPKILNLQNSKNATERVVQIHQVLAEAGVNTEVTLSLQSLGAQALKAIKRENISLKSYEELQQYFTQESIPTYTDIIMGLPGETYDSYANGVSEVIANGQHCRIQFYHASLLPNAELAFAETRQRYQIESVETPYNLHQPAIDNIREMQEFIIATDTMNKQDWQKARVFSWLTNLLHLNYQPLQIPFVIIHHLTGLSYRQLIETFMKVEKEQYPLLKALIEFLFDKANKVQHGESEQCHAKDLLGQDDSFFLPDQYLIIKLTFQEQIKRFFQESFLCLQDLIETHHQTLPGQLLDEMINYSYVHLLLSSELFAYRFAAKLNQLRLEVNYNFLEVYESILQGQSIELKKEKTVFYKDWPGPPFELKKKI